MGGQWVLRGYAWQGSERAVPRTSRRRGAAEEGKELQVFYADAAEAGVSGGCGGEAAGMGSQAAIRATHIALGGSGGGGLAALAQQRRLYH